MKTKTSDAKRLIILDSLRGLAALVVLYHHLFKLNTVYFNDHLSDSLFKIFNIISNLNKEAVIFFFILSGFSIGLSLKDKKLSKNEVLNEYFYRRLRRILPIYWMSLMLAFVSGLVMMKISLFDFSPFNLIGNLLFLQTSALGTPAWFTPYGFNGPLWSLAFEFFFYCLFPLIYIINYKKLTRLGTNIKFAILFLMTLVVIVLNKFFFVPYFYYFMSFIVWLMGYLSSQTYLLNKRYNALFLASASFAILYLLVGEKFVRSDSLVVLSKGLLMNAIFYFFTINRSFINSRNLFLEVFNTLFYSIGKGSYAIYALHYPIMLILQFYDIEPPYQLLIIGLFILISLRLEAWTIRWKMNFLKNDYLNLVKIN